MVIPGALPARLSQASALNVGIQTTLAPSLAETSTASGLSPPTDLFRVMAPAICRPGYIWFSAWASGAVG